MIQLTAFTEGRFDPAFGEAFHLEENCFWKEKNETKLDLGGVAKGYGVDLILERLQENGFHNIYVEWGGEIRVAGRHPANRPWKIAILGGEEMELNDEAIATSGSYQQNWIIDGVLYTHITDPKTQKPLTNPPITSASVRTPTCMEADAIATALMLIPSIKKAEDWAAQKELAVWLR